MADKKTAKKAVKKTAPKKSPMDELLEAVEKARKAGLTVRGYVANVDEDGTSIERNL